MERTLSGVFSAGDTREIEDWLEDHFGSRAEQKADLAAIRRELAVLQESVNSLHAKIDRVEALLEKNRAP